MNHFFALLGIVLLVFTSCNERESFETGIEKTVEIDFELNTNDIVNRDGLIDFRQNGAIINSDFSEYADKIKDIEVHGVNVRIMKNDRIPALARSASTFTLLDLNVKSIGNEPQNLDFFALEDLPFTNSQPIFLYKEDSTQSEEIENAVEFIRAKMFLNELIVWDLTGHLVEAPRNSRFTVKLSIDLTVTVELD